MFDALKELKTEISYHNNIYNQINGVNLFRHNLAQKQYELFLKVDVNYLSIKHLKPKMYF